MAEDELNTESHLLWEKECVRRIRDGDRHAFAELYSRFAERLFVRVLMPRLGNRQAAEDALSESFRTALERIGQFEPQGVSIYFWLSRIAVNKATDMHRVKARTARALTNFHGLMGPLARSSTETMERSVDAERLEGAVAEILSRINPRYRRAIELRFLEDRTREDCAAALEVKLGTFDVLLLRSLRAFRKEWVERIGEDTES